MRTIFFDLDNTLVDQDTARTAAAEEALRLASETHGLSLVSLADAYHRARRPTAVEKQFQMLLAGQRFMVPRSDRLDSPLQDLRRHWFTLTLDAFGISNPTLVDEMAHRYTRMLDELIRPYPDSIPTLALLSKRYMLGIISDGFWELQGKIIRRFELDRYCQCVVLAEDVGVQKPDARIFQTALERAGCLAAEAVHVGDTLSHDVVGAKALGIYAVWVNRHRVPLPPDALPPDHEVHTLQELLVAFNGFS